MESDSGCIPSSIWDLPEDEALEAAGILSACEQLLPLPLSTHASGSIPNAVLPSNHLQPHAVLPVHPTNGLQQQQGAHVQPHWQPVAGPDPAYAAAVQAAMGLINPNFQQQRGPHSFKRAPSARDLQAAVAGQAMSASPGGSSSGGNHQPDDMLEVAEQRRKSQNRGALAQKRFRERQKEKMRETERQVEQLSAALAALQADKMRLESRARLLEQVVSLNLQHEARLHTNKEIMVREQHMLLEDLVSFMDMLQLRQLLQQQQQQQLSLTASSAGAAAAANGTHNQLQFHPLPASAAVPGAQAAQALGLGPAGSLGSPDVTAAGAEGFNLGSCGSSTVTTLAGSLLGSGAEQQQQQQQWTGASAAGQGGGGGGAGGGIFASAVSKGQQGQQQQQQQQGQWLHMGASTAAAQTVAAAGGGGGGGLAGAVLSGEPGGGLGGGPAAADEVGTWKISMITEEIFPRYIHRLQQLLQAVPLMHGGSLGLSSSSSPSLTGAAAAAEVGQLVEWRRVHEDRRALFSHFYWALWCLNRRDEEAAGVQPPPGLWQQVLAALKLSPQQEASILAARHLLQQELLRVAGDWQQVLSSLALELLQVPREQWHSCRGVPAMVRNLVQEREAVLAFVHTVCDEVLTPLQEAQVEVACYPWCPDLWTLSTLISSRLPSVGDNQPDGLNCGNTGGSSNALKRAHSTSAPAATQAAGGSGSNGDVDPLPLLSQGVHVLQPLMPFMTAFQLLRVPALSKGAGGRLKRALLLDPFRTVVPAAAFPEPSLQEVQGLSLLEAHCGSFQKVMLWDWLKLNLPNYLTILPEVTSYSCRPAAS